MTKKVVIDLVTAQDMMEATDLILAKCALRHAQMFKMTGYPIYPELLAELATRLISK